MRLTSCIGWMDADELRLGQFEGQINIVCSFVVVLMLFLCIFFYLIFLLLSLLGETAAIREDSCHGVVSLIFINV